MKRILFPSVLLFALIGSGVWWLLPERHARGGTEGASEPVNEASARPTGRAAGEPTALARAPLPAVERQEPAAWEAAFAAAAVPLRHAYFSPGEVLAEEVSAEPEGRVVRRRFMRLPEYPERVYVEETFQALSDGSWALESQALEVAEEWILRVEPGERDPVDEIAAAEAGTIVHEIDPIGLWTLRFPVADFAARRALRARLEAHPATEAVMPNELVWTTATPDDPNFHQQWEMGAIAAEAGWDIATDAALNDRVNVVAAIIDTGVNLAHNDLLFWTNPGEIAGNGIDDDGNGRIDDVHGFDFYTYTADIHRSGGHGVTVSNIAGHLGNNARHKTAVSWKLELMGLVCFSTSGAGSTAAATSAIYYATQQGARVINCSFVGGSAATYNYVANYAADRNVIIVGGAGNDGKDHDVLPRYPGGAPNPNIVGVGATDSSDGRASYSNWGDTQIEVFAPAPVNGTSFATPMVSSMVALLVADDPEAPYTAIIDRLVKGVDVLPALEGKAISNGRVNLLKTLRLNSLRSPANLRAYALADGSHRLFWEDRATAESGYRVERSTTDPDTVRNPDDPAEMTWEVIADDLPADITTYTDTSAEGDSTYFYRVRAKGPEWNSARNFTTRVTPRAEPAPLAAVPDGTVRTLQHLAGPDRIRLGWLDEASNETAYQVERSEDGGATFYHLATLPADTTIYEDAEVTPGAHYTYRLKTVNAAAGAYSAPLATIAAEEENPVWMAAPTEVSAQAVHFQSIVLTWTDEALGETGYRVERATGAGDFALLAEVAADGTSLTDTAVSPETTYRYRVVVEGAKMELVSAEATATTPFQPATLEAPQLAFAGVALEGVDLTWEDASARHSGYRVERAPAAEGAFTALATLSPTTRAWSDPAVAPGESYRYRVIAFAEAAVSDTGLPAEVSSEVAIARVPTRYEVWAAAHFGTDASAAMAAASADPDGDGWSNLAEYATRQSPSTPQPFIAQIGMSSDRRMTLSFSRPVEPESTYIVEATSDLGESWSELARLPAGAQGWIERLAGSAVEETETAGGREVVVTDGPGPAGEPRYLRLVIAAP
ncbi:MAG: S8 family serine peptidase [Opitutales bacterium]